MIEARTIARRLRFWKASIGFRPRPDALDHDSLTPRDPVYHAVVTDAEPIQALQPFQLDRSRREGVEPEFLDLCVNLCGVCFQAVA